MRTYEITTTRKSYTVNAKSAQIAVNHIYSFIGEHDEVLSVVRIGSNGKRTECIWK